jgi:aryl-alcohol dehydrogenase-like predicted oxidoreductase
MQTTTLGPFTVSRLCLGTMLMGSKTPAARAVSARIPIRPLCAPP